MSDKIVAFATMAAAVVLGIFLYNLLTEVTSPAPVPAG